MHLHLHGDEPQATAAEDPEGERRGWELFHEVNGAQDQEDEERQPLVAASKPQELSLRAGLRPLGARRAGTDQHDPLPAALDADHNHGSTAHHGDPSDHAGTTGDHQRQRFQWFVATLGHVPRVHHEPHGLSGEQLHRGEQACATTRNPSARGSGGHYQPLRRESWLLGERFARIPYMGYSYRARDISQNDSRIGMVWAEPVPFKLPRIGTCQSLKPWP